MVTAMVSAALVRNTVDGLVRVGVDLAAVERTLGFGVDRLDDPDEHIPLRHMARLERAAAQLAGRPAVALEIAQHCQGDGSRAGVVGHLAASSPTVGEGFRLAVRHANLLGSGIRVALRTVGDRVEFVYARTEPASCTVQGVELALGEIACTLRRLAGAAGTPLSAHFRHQEPAYGTEYRAVFGESLHFGQAENKVVSSADVLDLPSPTAQPYVSRVLLDHADSLTARIDGRRPYSRRVHEHIMQQLPYGAASIDRTARTLGMSRQTLYRRLKEEGTSFQQLLETTRNGLAGAYLADPQHNLSEVALLLGFLDYSSFNRAVRRWYGTSPQEYRRRARDSG